jgi:hypothetical protein
MAVPAGVLRGRRRAAERQLLKNAEDEYAITALEAVGWPVVSGA